MVDSCAKIECPFSGVTKSGRIWRKVPENGAQSVTHTHTGAHIRNTTTTTHTLLTQPTYTHTPLLSPTRHTRTSLDLSTSLSPDQIATLVKKKKKLPDTYPYSESPLRLSDEVVALDSSQVLASGSPAHVLRPYVIGGHPVLKADTTVETPDTVRVTCTGRAVLVGENTRFQ